MPNFTQKIRASRGLLMTRVVSARHHRPIYVGIALLLLYVVWAADWWGKAHEGFDGWQTGDWLLNYDGGFVRRGLFGSALSAITPPGVSLISVATFVQLAFMMTMFFLVWLLYLRTDRSWAWVMVLFSPAMLMFPVLNLWAGARKEILVLVALAILALAFGRPRWHWTALAVLPLFVVSILSHESLVLTLPSFIYLIWNGGQGEGSNRTRNLLVAAYSVAGLSAATVTLTHSGTVEIAQGICRSWLEQGLPNCKSGALDALMATALDSREILTSELFPGYWAYLTVFALCLIPLYTVRFLPKHWVLTAVTFIALAPLFWIAWDYGRWIYLGVTQLSIISLAIGSIPSARKPMNVPLIAVLSFGLLWGFKHFGNPVFQDGLLISWLKGEISGAWWG